MISKLLLFYVFYVNYYFCLARISTIKNYNSVVCASLKEDLQNETPIILNPPIYKNKTDNKEYFELERHFYDWNVSHSRNLSLGPVLDKRWENFPVEEGNVLIFKSIQEITPFSVCANGSMSIRIIYSFTVIVFPIPIGETIFRKSNNETENKKCEWKHYFIEIQNQNIMIYQNYEKIISRKLLNLQFAKIKVITSGLSLWKRHFYEFQQFPLKENNLMENYNLGTIKKQGKLCISLYVALPRDLSLNIKLTSGELSVGKNISFVSMPSSNAIIWQNVKLNLHTNGTANLFIEATSEILNSNRFWLIDLKHLESCSKQYGFQVFAVSVVTQENFTCEAVTVDYKKLKRYFEDNLKIKNEKNQIFLNWNLPNDISNVVKYVVTYQLIEKCYCNINNTPKSNESNYLVLNGNERKVTIQNLEYFSKYSVNFSIVIDKENITIPKFVTTNISPDLEDIAMNLTFTEDNVVNLSFEDCNQFNGSVNITLSLKCTDRWCLNETQNDEFNTEVERLQKNISFTKFRLQTFTLYQPEVEIRRFNKTRTKTFPQIRTNPGYPRPVENLTAEAISNDVFLKWKAPYPPTGIVSYYTIKCEDEKDFYTEFNTSAVSYCTISHDFLCFKITNLQYDTKYFIKVLVKNENVKKTNSSMISINISTKQQTFEAPSNLTLNRSEESIPLGDMKDNIPIIEQCSNSSCSEEMKKSIMKNRDANSQKENDNVTTNFGEGAGRIFKLNKSTYPVLRNILIKLKFPEIIIQIITPSLIIAMLLLLCIYVIYARYCKSTQSYDAGRNYRSILKYKTEEPERIRLIKLERYQEEALSDAIWIENLEKYLLKNLTNNVIAKEYMSVPKDLREKSRSAALLPDNTKKNRYQNILPYDSSRVILQQNGENGDYINANYIDGYNCSKEFIATQAPKFNTIEDFWLMVWQNQASSIIMMTELNERVEIKSQKYWPELLETVTFGEFKITNRYEEIYPYFIERRLEICAKKEKRSVDHLQFTDWPDHGVPSHPQKIIQFLAKVLQLTRREIKIVHCNAGCGRTGSLILCEIALRMAFNEGRVDFPKILGQIRKQRVLQVNSLEQYIFCHLSVLEYLKVQQFSIPLSEDFVINSNLKSTLDNLEKLSELIAPKNERKLSEGSVLSYESSLASSESMLSTILVDSFSCRNKFFAVAQPAKAEIRKFWQLVREFNVNVIIFLDQVDSEFSFAVGKENSILRNSVLQCTEKYESLDSSKMTLNFDNDLIYLHKIKNWKNSLPKGECERSLISVLKELSENFWSCKILVVSDEVARNGLFIGLSLLLEKMISERVFDAFSAIRMLRQNENAFLQEDTQIDYLFEFAVKYLSVNTI